MKGWTTPLLVAMAGLSVCAGCVGGKIIDPSSAAILDDHRQPRPYPAAKSGVTRKSAPRAVERSEPVGTGVETATATKEAPPAKRPEPANSSPAANEVTIANRHQHIPDQSNVLQIPPTRISSSSQAVVDAQPTRPDPVAAVTAPVQPLPSAPPVPMHASPPEAAKSTVATTEKELPPKVEIPPATTDPVIPTATLQPTPQPEVEAPAVQEAPKPVALHSVPASPKTAEELLPDDASERAEWLRTQYIKTLESTIRASREVGQKETANRLDQQLRLAYLLADNADEASRAVDSLPEPERESYKQLLFALSQLLSEDDARRPAHRNARVAKALREAIRELTPASRLELKNLAFCERVEHYGWYTEFRRPDFTPKQQVILYVEVENATAEEKGQHNFETELAGSYQIFDAAGNLAAERSLPLDKETCRNYRRDYFLAYRVYIPEDLQPGQYRLELTLEDLKAKRSGNRKLGEAMIEFRVRSS